MITKTQAASVVLQPPATAEFADPVATSPEPICFIVDQDAYVRTLISSVVEPLHLGVRHFDTPDEMLQHAETGCPGILFIDITTNASNGMALIQKLGRIGIHCPIQVTSGLNPLLVEQIRRSGEQTGLRMLPVLQKPFRANAVKAIVQELGLRRDPSSRVHVTLEEVLRNDWLEMWYQPQIDLKTNLMVGTEAFVRARHPELGVLAPDAFLADTSEAELLELTPRVFARVLRDWRTIAELGVVIQFSINIPVCALTKLSLFGLLWEESPGQTNWPSLILEISEEEVIPNLEIASKAERELRAFGVKLSIDNFGMTYAELSRRDNLPFSEVKIDRAYISDCDASPLNAGLCETIVEFAHRAGITAVAEGIETRGELGFLRKVGCDTGQGYIFARPLPKDQFVALVRQRLKPR